MPDLQTIAKAVLQEIEPGRDGGASTTKGDPVEVQFNPQTLKLNYSNQQSGNGQPRGSGTQFVGRGVTKLALDLVFDVTAPVPNKKSETDVRKLTEKVAYFIRPQPPQGGGRNQPNVPPAVRFSWGSFLFEGVMESMNETLEFFSCEGEPLRASVSISLMRQETNITYNPDFERAEDAAPGAITSGTEPNQAAKEGDTVQKMAAGAGKTKDWKSIAAANNIENPRMLQPGTLVNLNARGGGALTGGVPFGQAAGSVAVAGGAFAAAGSAIAARAGGPAIPSLPGGISTNVSARLTPRSGGR